MADSDGNEQLIVTEAVSDTDTEYAALGESCAAYGPVAEARRILDFARRQLALETSGGPGRLRVSQRVAPSLPV
jgi:hypothetical protein